MEGSESLRCRTNLELSATHQNKVKKGIGRTHHSRWRSALTEVIGRQLNRVVRLFISSADWMSRSEVRWCPTYSVSQRTGVPRTGLMQAENGQASLVVTDYIALNDVSRNFRHGRVPSARSRQKRSTGYETNTCRRPVIAADSRSLRPLSQTRMNPDSDWCPGGGGGGGRGEGEGGRGGGGELGELSTG